MKTFEHGKMLEVGDWVRLPFWDRPYEVCKMDEDKGAFYLLDASRMTVGPYFLNEQAWNIVKKADRNENI